MYICIDVIISLIKEDYINNLPDVNNNLNFGSSWHPMTYDSVFPFMG